MSRRCAVLISLIASLAHAVPGEGQTADAACAIPSGAPERTVSGVVADAQGARVADATVTFRCGAFGRRVQTGPDGTFRVPLAPGHYEMRVQRRGFAIHSQPVLVPADRGGEIAVTLAVDSIAEDVRVVASALPENRSRVATRLDLSLRQTPQSVSIVPRTRMEDFALHSAAEVLAAATTVRVERVETDRTYFSARGFDISNFQVDGLGLPFATGDQIGDIDTAVYERVEVLRGANGLLSFTGNPSATVNYVRKRPTAAFQASAGVMVGSWKNRRVDADIGGPLNASGTVRARLTAAGQDKQSYLDRYSLTKTVFSGVIDAAVARRTRLSVGHMQQQNEPDAPMWGALPMYFADGSPTRYDRSTSTAADWAFWNTGDAHSFVEVAQGIGAAWQARATVTRRGLDSDAELFYVYGTPDRTTGLGLFSWPSKYWSTERRWLADASVTGPFTLGSRQHQLVLGVNWSRSDNALRSSDDDLNEPLPALQTWEIQFPMARPSFDRGVTGQADFLDRRQSLYGALHLELTEHLNVITAANVTRAESTGDQYGEPHRYSRTKTSPYLGAVYDIDARHSVYASYARIFNPQSKIDEFHAVLPPIEGSSLEVGAKGEWFTGRFNATASVFRTAQKNTAEYAGFADGASYYKGVDGTSTGVELEAVGTIGAGLQLTAAFTRFRLVGNDGEDVRTFVPRGVFRVASTYRLPAFQPLTVGASLNWQSRTHRVQGVDAAGSEIVSRQDAYALIDLMARYAINQRLSASVHVNNLTDTRHYASLYWPQNYYGAPRNAALTLHYKF